MRHAAWARRVGSFATRLVLAVLVTACLTAACQSLLAGRLAVRAMEREAVTDVVAAAARLQARTADRGDATAAEQQEVAESLATLAARRGVLDARVVPAPPSDEPTAVHRVWSGREVLVVTVPVRLGSGPVGLQVSVDAADARHRSAPLRRALLVVIGLGAVAAVPLALLLGGRRLLRRHRDVVVEAGTDDLTGLGTRRAFLAELADEVTRCRRAGLHLGIALVEVSGLGLVRASVGRRRSDAMLADVGSAVGRRHPGQAYRLGGDTFAVVLPGLGTDEVFAAADALRAELCDVAPPLTVAVGVAALDERCTDAETLVIAADAALDEARALGGNRVVGPGDAGFGLRWVANRPQG